MDRETFKTMWKMSAPGTESEHLFLRVSQFEYFAEEEIRFKALYAMPDVSEVILTCRWFDVDETCYCS